jgi:hypothetical protein
VGDAWWLVEWHPVLLQQPFSFSVGGVDEWQLWSSGEAEEQMALAGFMLTSSTRPQQ